MSLISSSIRHTCNVPIENFFDFSSLGVIVSADLVLLFPQVLFWGVFISVFVLFDKKIEELSNNLIRVKKEISPPQKK